MFGDQTDPCAQFFFQYLQANPQYAVPANSGFTNPAAQAIGAALGMTCPVWMGMSDLARRQWVAATRFGNPGYYASPQVVHLVGQMNASCPRPGARPAGQTAPATQPPPAWTAAAYTGFATLNQACKAWATTAAQAYQQYITQPVNTAIAPTATTAVTPAAPAAAPAASSGISTKTLLIVAGIAAAGGIGYWLYTRQSKPTSAQSKAEDETEEVGS